MYPYQPYNRRAYFSPHHGFYVPNNYNSYPFTPYYSYRQLPEVNPSIFMTSAIHMQRLMKDASLLLDKMARSRKFSLDLMSAAQKSNQVKVDQLIKDTGVKTTPKATYTPDGLKLHFQTYAEDIDCCHLTLNLRWM